VDMYSSAGKYGAVNPKDANELTRLILQACGSCKFGQGRGRGLVCTKKGPCHKARVKHWMQLIEKQEVSYE